MGAKEGKREGMEGEIAVSRQDLEGLPHTDSPQIHSLHDFSYELNIENIV